MKSVFLLSLILLVSGCVSTPSNFTYKNVSIKWLGQSGFEITGDKKIYTDPFMINFTDAADFILLTHGHFDHCDSASIKKLQNKNTVIIGAINCIKTLSGNTNALRPGEFISYRDGIKIEAVESYNINKTYHPKVSGIGLIITIDNVTIYHAGDTDFIQSMDRHIDIALVPIGGTYTMDVAEAAAAVRILNPTIVVPIHYNSKRFGINDIDADPGTLKQLLGDSGIEVKILSASAW